MNTDVTVFGQDETSEQMIITGSHFRRGASNLLDRELYRISNGKDSESSATATLFERETRLLIVAFGAVGRWYVPWSKAMHHASPLTVPIQHDGLSDGSLEMEKGGGST